MGEFVDKDREISEKFYEVMEGYTGKNLSKTVTSLKKIIEQDPYFLDPYLFLAELLKEDRKQEEGKIYIVAAYEKALELILDKDGNWPEEMLWEWIENRHIIRTLIIRGLLFWKDSKNDDALSLFEKLLKTNPNDNGGVRYFMLAILCGMSEAEFNRKFDKGGYWDSEIDEWFKREVVKHEKHFSKWLEFSQVLE